MNSLEISKILKHHHKSRTSYVGCFPSDMIPLIKKYPASIVLNTDDSSSPGTHWVAIYCPNSYTVEYFDSYSMKPNENIAQFLSKFQKVVTSNKPLQDVFSDVCGHFCIYFIINRSLGQSFHQIIDKLSKIKLNDEYVKHFVENLYG